MFEELDITLDLYLLIEEIVYNYFSLSQTVTIYDSLAPVVNFTENYTITLED